MLSHDPMPNIKDMYNTPRRNEKHHGIQRSTHLDSSTVYGALGVQHGDFGRQ